MLLNLESRRLEWIVNGYEALSTRAATAPAPAVALPQVEEPVAPHAETRPQPAAQKQPNPPGSAPAKKAEHHTIATLVDKIEKSALFKIVGSDGKVYGPVTGEKLIAWLLDERIDPKSLAQRVGENTWKALTDYIKAEAPPPIPPLLSAVEALWKKRR